MSDNTNAVSAVCEFEGCNNPALPVSIGGHQVCYLTEHIKWAQQDSTPVQQQPAAESAGKEKKAQVQEPAPPKAEVGITGEELMTLAEEAFDKPMELVIVNQSRSFTKKGGEVVAPEPRTWKVRVTHFGPVQTKAGIRFYVFGVPTEQYQSWNKKPIKDLSFHNENIVNVSFGKPLPKATFPVKGRKPNTVRLFPTYRTGKSSLFGAFSVSPEKVEGMLEKGFLLEPAGDLVAQSG